MPSSAWPFLDTLVTDPGSSLHTGRPLQSWIYKLMLQQSDDNDTVNNISYVTIVLLLLFKALISLLLFEHNSTLPVE